MRDEGAEMRLFVNRYIRTRARPVNDANRKIVEAAIRGHASRFPADFTELERLLDEQFELGWSA